MKCIFMDDDGICHGRYKGFKCIEDKCEWYGKYMIPEGICAYWRDGYCKKLKIFTCDGKNKECPYYTDYLEEEEYKLVFEKK